VYMYVKYIHIYARTHTHMCVCVCVYIYLYIHILHEQVDKASISSCVGGELVVYMYVKYTHIHTRTHAGGQRRKSASGTSSGERRCPRKVPGLRRKGNASASGARKSPGFCHELLPGFCHELLATPGMYINNEK
jgi:hypothetical protein